jgi:hypothetical protein
MKFYKIENIEDYKKFRKENHYREMTDFFCQMTINLYKLPFVIIQYNNRIEEYYPSVENMPELTLKEKLKKIKTILFRKHDVWSNTK